MKKSNLEPDKYTFPSVINACAGLGDVGVGEIVYNDVMRMGFVSDLYICNALIYMYSRIGELGKAHYVFDEMPVKDIVSWNSLISGYSANGYWEEAIDIYHRSRIENFVPGSITFSGVLYSCGCLVDVKEGRVVHALIEKIGYRTDAFVNNGLLSMYCKFESFRDCEMIFNEMAVKDNVTWNTIICTYCQLGLVEKSIKLFKEMVCNFDPDLLTITSVLRVCGQIGDLKFGKYVHDYMNNNGYEIDATASNILINMYAKCGDLLGSREAFERAKCKDIVSWNSMISAYVQNGLYEEAIKVMSMMKMEIEPDHVTYTILLSLSSDMANVKIGRGLHGEIIKVGFISFLIVGNTLIDMYCKCCILGDSIRVFESMRVCDIVTWNSIIASSIHSEDSKLGFELIIRMRNEGIKPDTATILSILPICSKLAAIRQGKEIHTWIFKYGFECKVPVGNALIEMYSHCGLLRNSLVVFKHMKTRDIVTWTSLITAYGMHGYGREALKAFRKMEKAGFSPDHIAFIAILYACSHSGLVNEGRGYFHRMKKDYNLEPNLEHYACMVDILSRSGYLLEAEEFIKSMPMTPDASIWGALLSGSRGSGNIKLAERASEYVIDSVSVDSGYYILASNVYADLGKWDKVRKIRKSLRAKGLEKDPGCSWMDI